MNSTDHEHYWQEPTKLTDVDPDGIEWPVVAECACGEVLRGVTEGMISHKEEQGDQAGLEHEHYWEMPTKLTDFNNQGIERKVAAQCQCGETVFTSEET